jgi:hypothetical protein
VLERGDVRSELNFFCEIGEVKALVGLHVEPAPHGDPSHGHLHVSLLCEKVCIPDFPEPDRCSLTNRTCPFQLEFGHHLLHEESRKKDYANQILLSSAHIEYYGAIRLRRYHDSQGLSFNQRKLNLSRIIQLLKTNGLIDPVTYAELVRLKDCRNRLAHQVDALEKYTEQELYSFTVRAQKLIDTMRTTQSQLIPSNTGCV